jgi:hypothetical protein
MTRARERSFLASPAERRSAQGLVHCITTWPAAVTVSFRHTDTGNKRGPWLGSAQAPARGPPHPRRLDLLSILVPETAATSALRKSKSSRQPSRQVLLASEKLWAPLPDSKMRRKPNSRSRAFARFSRSARAARHGSPASSASSCAIRIPDRQVLSQRECTAGIQPRRTTWQKASTR